jgi:hypothetical protein
MELRQLEYFIAVGTRCWFGNQFSLVAPRFANHGVQLWIPELGGRFDSKNPSHKMLMSVLGGMSESERQHIQARVRAAMDAQVRNEGRHQGGRAPFGYLVVDGGCHPNPRKSAEGYRLRVLAIDEEAAGVVRRIFADYLDGKGDRAIAEGLNRDGVPCLSARRPDQNRHRLADGWQGSTVGAILQNPKYTGYAIFGRWTKTEILMDPDNVSEGHVVRFRRASSGSNRQIATASTSGDSFRGAVHGGATAPSVQSGGRTRLSPQAGARCKGNEMAVRTERHGALRIVRSPDGGNTSPFEERIADVLQMRSSKHRSRFRGAVEPSEERLSRREGCHRTAQCMDRSTLRSRASE